MTPRAFDIGQSLKRWREARGVSQRDLADRSGVSHITIARIETGRQDPTVGLLARLAGALRIRLADLFATPRRPLPRSAKRVRPTHSRRRPIR